MKKVVSVVIGLIMLFGLSMIGVSCVNPISTVTPTAVEVPHKQLVEDFIKNGATYAFDGIDGSIKIIRITGSASGEKPNTVYNWTYELEYQTSHPGHGDRTGQMLAQVISKHSATISIVNGEIDAAVCDEIWDMKRDTHYSYAVSGTIISGGDTTLPDGPLDTPRRFMYVIQQEDGNLINVAYTSYPPSPVGDANRAKITLEFAGGSINPGDRMEALGRLDQETNTIVVADQGNYIRTYPPQALPTVSDEVSWQMGDTVVAATITRPDDKLIHPAVVLVAGSGPTDRDWNSSLLPGTNGSAKLLAEELAKSGYVTIRYDKRVAGPNAQQNMPFLTGKISMESHVDELAGAVNLLLTRSDVNQNQIFVLANSEGTIHALNYQLTREPKFTGLILDGMPGRNMADLLRSQLEGQLVSLPDSTAIMAGYDKLMVDFLAGKPFVADPTLPEGINNLFQGFNAPLNLPFTRELFQLNPAPLLGEAKAPILVIIGKKDIQVDYQLDGGPLESAAAGSDNVSFVYPENTNHVLKFEDRPREALNAADTLTYNASDRILDPEALSIIKEWLIVEVSRSGETK